MRGEYTLLGDMVVSGALTAWVARRLYLLVDNLAWLYQHLRGPREPRLPVH